MNIIEHPADLNAGNMQAPLGNCKIENDVILEHVHHGWMGNYESPLTIKLEKTGQ